MEGRALLQLRSVVGVLSFVMCVHVFLFPVEESSNESKSKLFKELPPKRISKRTNCQRWVAVFQPLEEVPWSSFGGSARTLSAASDYRAYASLAN